MMRTLISELSFLLMAWKLRKRETPQFTDPVLAQAGIVQGMTVLDFGCGPGAFTFAAARMVGPEGRVFAIDRHPAAIGMVKKKTAARGFTTIMTVLSDRGTGCPAGSVDVVLFYDVLHGIQHPEPVLAEFRRILRSGGTLSVSDHHMKSPDIRRLVESTGGFLLAREGERSLTFAVREENEKRRQDR